MNSTQHQTRVDTQRQHVFLRQLHSIRLGRVVEIELEIQERSAKVSASHNKKANTVCCSSCPLSHWEFGMSTIQVKLAVVVLCVTLSMASTADAQRYRFLRSSPSVSKYSTPTYSARRPRPATGMDRISIEISLFDKSNNGGKGPGCRLVTEETSFGPGSVYSPVPYSKRVDIL